MPYANNNGVKIHYEVEGRGPPLIWQHGLTDCLETWYEVGYVKELKDDYRLILVDSRGHGESDKPHDVESYRPDVIASDYVRILDDLDIENAHFWGYSMGAMFGFNCIARHALHRVTSLILGGNHPYGNRTEAERQSFQNFINGLVAAAEKGTEAWVSGMETSGNKLPDWRRSQLLKNDLNALVALVSADINGSAEDVLPNIDVPCLIYAGEADPCFTKAGEAAKAIHGASFFPLPGFNHLQAYLRSDVVLPHVKKFLAEG